MKLIACMSCTLFFLVMAGACSSSSKGISSGSGGVGGAGGVLATGGSSATGGIGGLAGNCAGTADDCDMFSDASACKAVGCTWDSRVPEWCTGEAWPCSTFTTPGSCASAGCEWLASAQPDAGSKETVDAAVEASGADVAPDFRRAEDSSIAVAPDSRRAEDSSLLISSDGGLCDGSAMNGTWYRALDSLSMILTSDGCTITGSADNTSYRHGITGTYDSVARTLIGRITRTNRASGCTTIMLATWVLTDPTHFTLMITSTDGACDLLRTYNEQSVFVRKSL